MAETDAPAAAGGKGLEFLKHKAGPLPVGVWIVAAAGIWWYFQHKKSGAAAGTATDPAGNTGVIDPRTGYVYGSTQDTAALGSQSGGGGSGGSTGTSGSTTAGQYQDNNAWSHAAINYLVGLGVDPTQANEAIQSYLGSQQLTTQQQGDVNLAIQGIGAPPSVPGPVGTAPGGVVTPPGGGVVYANNPPTGLTVTGTNSTSIGLKWNSVTNATGYTISYSGGSGSSGQTTTSGTQTSTVVGGLAPSTMYNFVVQATPAKSGDPSASTSASTTAGTGSGSGNYKTINVKGGEWLENVATANHTTVATLWALNPDMKVAQANSGGFISPTNPIRTGGAAAGVTTVFASDQTIKVPA